ncbi:MAG: hypothetical protein NXI31_19765 [bacterium]|nr:hypothetical protein [bacterium]
MSPIGRVFIVLNLALAGGFVVFAGTHLQQQHNYKSQLEEAQTAAAEKEKQLSGEIARLEDERTSLEVAKTARETELNATKNSLQDTSDENKRLAAQLSSLEGDVKSLVSTAEASNSQSQAAFKQATDAFNEAKASQTARDEAINEKNAAVAENRTLRNTIASLEATVRDKDVSIAGLEKERSELNLLVSVAQENGFVPGLAAPALAGTVAHVANNRLCTIKITDNPGNVDIADQVAKRKFSFAIYDASGYKGEAVVTGFHAADNAVTCRLVPHKGEIKEGDSASTKTP